VGIEMTRINVGVNPEELMDQHLIAEIKEIPQLIGQLRKSISSKNFSINDIPSSFRLGTGHVKFFYDKVNYLKDRYESLLEESKYRNFNCRYMLFLDNLPKWCFGEYKENEKDRLIIVERINSKIKMKPTYYRNRRHA
jgi:deoxyribonuclease (pyrimidine dimer)